MFSDPFNTDFGCIDAVAKFLLQHCAEKEHLWTESLEEISRKPCVYSLWASGDIALSLLDLKTYLTDKCTDSKINSKSKNDLSVKIDETIKLCIDKFLDIHKNHIQAYNKSQKSRDIVTLYDAEKVSIIHSTLAELVRETIGYYGFPRSYSPPSDNATRGSWGATNIIVSCSVSATIARAADMNIVNRGDENIRGWLSDFKDYLSRPELSVLRQTLHELDTRCEEESIDKDIVDFDVYWNAISKAYNINIDKLKPNIDKFPFFNSKSKIPTELSELIRENRFFGCYSIDQQDFTGGWTSIPFQRGTFIDSLATLSALEELVSFKNKNEFKNTTQKYVMDVFERSLHFLENGVKDKLLRDDWYDAARNNKDLSTLWPLGFLCRSVVAYVRIEASLKSSSCALRELDNEKASQYLDVVLKLREVMYTALLIKVFRLEVEVRSPPYEAIPVALVAGNELSHWPGLDTGYVALALLRGWPNYKWQEAAEQYHELIKLKDRIFPTKWKDESQFPMPPVFHATIDMVKQQIVGPHNEKIVRDCLGLKGIHFTDEKTLKGAFLANIGTVPGREFDPTIYFWATAHALSALVEWIKLSDQEQRELDLLKSNLANLTQESEAENKRSRIRDVPVIKELHELGKRVTIFCLIIYISIIAIDHLFLGFFDESKWLLSVLLLSFPCIFAVFSGKIVKYRANNLLTEDLNLDETAKLQLKGVVDSYVYCWSGIFIFIIGLIGWGGIEFNSLASKIMSIWEFVGSHPKSDIIIKTIIVIIFSACGIIFGKGTLKRSLNNEIFSNLILSFALFKLLSIQPDQKQEWDKIDSDLQELKNKNIKKDVKQ